MQVELTPEESKLLLKALAYYKQRGLLTQDETEADHELECKAAHSLSHHDKDYYPGP